MYDIYFFLTSLLLASYGLFVAWTVYATKKKGESLTCSINHGCDDVVNSKYGKTFGVENALLGSVYYAGMMFVHGVLLVRNDVIFGMTLQWWVLLGAVGAALFSLYLMGVMVFILKMRCDWCIRSAITSNTLALLALLAWFL